MRVVLGRQEDNVEVSVDLDVLVNSRLLIQANSGAGKSWCIRRLLEQTNGKIQQIVIDPEGEFASLRERYDYVLAAKTGGDTAADSRSAKVLAERLLELGVSAVLDIYELDPRERVKFVRCFLESMVDAPKHLWHPVLIVLDEAHVYAPEQGEAESAGAVKGLATRGRKRGFCLVAATQRLAKLHKDVAAECNNKLIGRTSLDTDMRRAGDELGWDKHQRMALRDLESGEFLAYGPALTRTVTKMKVGPVLTTHPKAGSKLAAVVPPPTDKVKKVLARLADLPKEVEQRATTEADLRRQLSEAQQKIKELTRTPSGGLTPQEVSLMRDVAKSLNDQAGRLSRVVAEIQDHVGTVVRAGMDRAVTVAQNYSREFAAELKAASEVLGKFDRAKTASLPVMATRPARVVAHHRDVGDQSLPPGERAVLGAAAMYPDGVSRDQLGVLTGYKRSSRDAYIARLVSKGHVEVMAGNVVATESGVAALGDDFEPLPTGHELLEWWRRKLPDGERKVLDLLVTANKPVDREEIDRATGYKRSSRDAYLSRLASRRLVEQAGRGSVVASPLLFG